MLLGLKPGHACDPIACLSGVHFFLPFVALDSVKTLMPFVAMNSVKTLKAVQSPCEPSGK
jgi:hypothetical protein